MITVMAASVVTLTVVVAVCELVKVFRDRLPARTESLDRNVQATVVAKVLHDGGTSP